MTKTMPPRIYRPDISGKGTNRYGNHHDLPKVYELNKEKLKELGITKTQFQDICVTYNEALVDKLIEKKRVYMLHIGMLEFRKKYLCPIIKERLINRLKKFNMLWNPKWFFLARIDYALPHSLKRNIYLTWCNQARAKFNQLYQKPEFDCLELVFYKKKPR